MPVYEGVQSIANYLLGEYQAQGFRLVPDEDKHTLTLYYQDEIVPITNTTIKGIREACERRLLLKQADEWYSAAMESSANIEQICCRECRELGMLYLKGSECIYLCTIKEHNPGMKIKPCPYKQNM